MCILCKFNRIDHNSQIRVGDFGLTEDIYARNYFRQGSNDGVKLPVKWMSPESLKLGIFSEKSDVVRFFVLEMCECFNY